MRNLHTNQRKLLEYLEGIESFDGISLWDIARQTGLNNAQTVKHHLSQLEKLGYLRRNLKNSSSFEILKSPIEDIVYIPLLGFAMCGNSGDFFSEENLEDRIAVSTKLLGISNLENTFAIKA
jgi:SOS-response transcriptional repressor LexA